MSTQGHFEYDIPENNMTAPECLKTTADDIFDEASFYLKGVFYEDRLIELMHLKPRYAADESNPHVIYKAYGLGAQKTGIIMANASIHRPDSEDSYFPKENSRRHYFLETITDAETSPSNSELQPIKALNDELLGFIGNQLLNDSWAVRCENTYNDSIQGDRSLLAGVICNNFDDYDDPYSRLMHTFNADMHEIQEATPISAAGYGSFHQIKNYTRF
jgi:hypothetical protein